MSDAPLVLSLFPGIGLLDRAFEAEGFTVVRGPDVLWGGDVRTFHAPAGRFDGVVGGPPCQVFSPMAAFGGTGRFGNLIPEFERVVGEAQPDWWLMENVPTAPEPAVAGYRVRHLRLNNRWVGDGLGAEQNRVRRFSFGTRDGRALPIEVAPLLNPVAAPAVTSAHQGEGRRARPGVKRYRFPEARRLQGLPADFLDHAPFTLEGKLKAVANGVPLPLGRAVAAAVRRAFAAQPARNPVPD